MKPRAIALTSACRSTTPAIASGPGLIDSRVHLPHTWGATSDITCGPRLIDSRVHPPHTWSAASDIARGARLIDPRINDTPSRRADSRHGRRRTGDASHRDPGGRAVDLRVCDGRDCGQADRSDDGNVSLCHGEWPLNKMGQDIESIGVPGASAYLGAGAAGCGAGAAAGAGAGAGAAAGAGAGTTTTVGAGAAAG